MLYGKVNTSSGMHCRVDRSGIVQVADVEQVVFPVNDERLGWRLFNLDDKVMYVQGIPVQPGCYVCEQKCDGVYTGDISVSSEKVGASYKAWEDFKCIEDVNE